MRFSTNTLLFWAIAGLTIGSLGCHYDDHHHHGAGGGGGGGGGTTTTAPVTFMDFQTAAIVLGQLDFAGQLPNQGAAASPNTLNGPFGRVAEGSLYVPDQFNNRILGFSLTPNVNGGAGDFALGQPDLTTVTAAVTPNKMSAPTDAWVTGTRLVVADRANNRVLIWNGLPTTSGAAPSVVVGQVDFVSNGAATTQTGLSMPASACIGGGKLFVADFANNRVLIWNALPGANGAAASVVLGQAGFGTSAAGATSTTMNGPSSVWSDGARLAVADSANNRVLIWRPVPTTNGAAANLVVGQPDFTTVAAGAGAQGLSNPSSVFATSAQLIVADRGNHRVLNYRPFPVASQPAATNVLGQGNFVNMTPNDDDQNGAADAMPSSKTLNTPTGVYLKGMRLYVTDQGNNRVLRFDGS